VVTPEPERSGSPTAWERAGQLALVLLFLLALAGGFAVLARQSRPPGVEVVLPTPTPEGTLRVHLSGAVASPGVHAFRDGERVGDLLARTGGTTSDADLGRVNLALRLRDEALVHVPRFGEAIAPSDAAQPDGGQARLDLNTATLSQLEALPGIGEVRAAAILEYRESHGGFDEVGELLAVSGLGPATVEAIADLVTAD
jgi:competence protein ComEA